MENHKKFNNNPKLKVLPLESWMTYSDRLFLSKDEYIEEMIECGKQIAPIIDRDGYYYDRANKSCWFESGGYAFISSPETFLYSLSLLNHCPLSDKEVKSIECLMDGNVKIGKELKTLYYKDREWKDIRETGRNARLYCLKILKD